MAKVDFTALATRERGEYICVLNFAIPLEETLNVNSLEANLTRVSNFLARHFGDKRAFYSLNASFKIVNTKNQDVRTFTGSFYPNALTSMSLSGPLFLLFQPATFLQHLRPLMTVEHARNVLLPVVNDETDWQFDSVVSFIVSVQLSLTNENAFMRHYDLGSVRQGRKRRQVTLYNF